MARKGHWRAGSPDALQDRPTCTIFIAEAISPETSFMLAGMIRVVAASLATLLKASTARSATFN